MANWTIRNVKAEISKISEKFGVSELFSTLLVNRGISNKRLLDTYIKSDCKFFYCLKIMKDVEKSFHILKRHIDNGSKIVIYGDYDVDGVTSTTIMYKALKNLTDNVSYYIPNREEEGYGLNNDAISYLNEQGTKLIFTCDNGIASLSEVKFLKSLNMEIIILDHHEPQYLKDENNEKVFVLPMADAIIDAKQIDCNYPFKFMCTGGLAYRYVKEFYDFFGIKFDFEEEAVVFAAIATICDIVDLIDENRIIVKMGIDFLNKNKKINKGLYELIKLKGLEFKEIDEFTFGFVIGPCINAGGRLETALKVVNLFNCEDELQVVKLAEELSLLNDERKKLTKVSYEKIINSIENSDFKNDKVLVVYAPDVHESIAGIVAGRIKEKLFKPTIVITNSNDIAKGSGRSIPSYNIFEEMSKYIELFLRFGGHPMAVGLSIKPDNIPLLRKRLNGSCTLTSDDMVEVISIDKNINFDRINYDLFDEIQFMKPFGKSNREPIFATKGVNFSNIRFVGKNKDMLQILIKDSFNISMKAISFDGFYNFKSIVEENISKEYFHKLLVGEHTTIDLIFDIVYNIALNDFNGNKNLQLNIKDFRLSS